MNHKLSPSLDDLGCKINDSDPIDHSSGKEIDFSVHDGEIEEVVTTVGRIREGVSDHAFQNFLVKY